VTKQNAWQVMHHPSLASTQAHARSMIDTSTGPLHRVSVTTDQQTAGVGRRGSTFESPPGGAYQTLVLHEPSLEWVVSPSLAVGLAFELAFRLRQEGFDSQIKWPNDVYLGDLKAGGILMERHAGHLLIGVGLNALNAPPAGAAQLGRSPEIVRAWVRESWDALDRAGGNWLARREEVPHVLAGRRVRVGGSIGQVLGIASDGRLVLNVDGEPTHVTAGHVELLPPSGS